MSFVREKISKRKPMVIALAAYGDLTHSQALYLEEYTHVETHDIYSLEELVEYVNKNKDAVDIRAVILSEFSVPLERDVEYLLPQQWISPLKVKEYHLDELDSEIRVEKFREISDRKRGRCFENLQNYIQKELKLPAFASLDVDIRKQIDVIKEGKSFIAPKPNWVDWTKRRL
jgi:hypothetical protein